MKPLTLALLALLCACSKKPPAPPSAEPFPPPAADYRPVPAPAEYLADFGDELPPVDWVFYFELNRAEITDLGQVAAVASLVRSSPSNFLIRGHACPLGSEAHNQGLSERRAKAAFNALVAAGAPAEKLVLDAVGEAEPVTLNPENFHLNRRVEIAVLK